MNKLLLIVFLLICAAVAFLTANGGRYGGVALPWAKPVAADNAIITFSADNGFSPSSITVNSGDTVEIRNLSNDQIDIESDSMTTDQNKSDRELSIGAITSNSHKDITLTTKGSFQYHNDVHPEQTGMITVQ